MMCEYFVYVLVIIYVTIAATTTTTTTTTTSTAAATTSTTTCYRHCLFGLVLHGVRKFIHLIMMFNRISNEKNNHKTFRAVNKNLPAMFFFYLTNKKIIIRYVLNPH